MVSSPILFVPSKNSTFLMEPSSVALAESEIVAGAVHGEVVQVAVKAEIVGRLFPETVIVIAVEVVVDPPALSVAVAVTMTPEGYAVETCHVDPKIPFPLPPLVSTPGMVVITALVVLSRMVKVSEVIMPPVSGVSPVSGSEADAVRSISIGPDARE